MLARVTDQEVPEELRFLPTKARVATPHPKREQFMRERDEYFARMEEGDMEEQDERDGSVYMEACVDADLT